MQFLLGASILCLSVFASCRADGPPAPPNGGGGNGTEAPDESFSLKKLRQELLVTRQYDRMSRPVKNHLTQTKVDMRITINEFVELDTVNSLLVTDAWFHITWKDELLTWDPNDYQQLKQIHMNPNEIWKPDLVLINTANQDNLLNIFTDSEVLVNSTGEVTWITMGLLRSKCPIWAYDYPFTVRPVNCRLTFCSLIYQSHEVNITTPGNEFFLAGPWFVNPRLQFINITGERYERYYEGYGTYSFESLTVQLKRRDNALPLIMKIPTLASITMVLCMFFLPVTWPVRLHLALFAIFIQLLLILYVGLQLGVNAIGLARPISYLRDDLFLSSMALVLTLLFRRLLVLADLLPDLPYLLSSLLAGPIARLLCFGINQNEYCTASAASKNATASFGGKPSARVFEPTSLPTSRSRLNLRSSRSGNDHVSLVDETDQEDSMIETTNSPSSAAASSSIGLDMSGADQQPMASTILISGGQYEWMQLIIFCDRLLFVFYALIMVPRLL